MAQELKTHTTFASVIVEYNTHIVVDPINGWHSVISKLQKALRVVEGLCKRNRDKW